MSLQIASYDRHVGVVKPAPEYCVVHIERGGGMYQVDFQNYLIAGETVIFLNPGQYFTPVSGAFSFTVYDVPREILAADPHKDAELRLLFTHVYEVGRIIATDPASKGLGGAVTREGLMRAAHVWSRQKPFHPQITLRETALIFDLRGLVEAQYRDHRPVDDFGRQLALSARRVNQITTSRIQRGIAQLVEHRLLLEAKRLLTFADLSVKEVAFELGFKDPAYFSRFFSKRASESPAQFREHRSPQRTDPFLDELLQTLEKHYRHEKSVRFFAELLHVTPKTLSDRVKRITGQPFGALINQRIIGEARELLGQDGVQVQEIARSLGFEDAFHFSRFFKRETGVSPKAFRALKDT